MRAEISPTSCATRAPVPSRRSGNDAQNERRAHHALRVDRGARQSRKQHRCEPKCLAESRCLRRHFLSLPRVAFADDRGSA